MEIRKDCPYCGNKLVPWTNTVINQDYLRCENCHYKVMYSNTEQK